jgi:hypothetical protein
MTVCVCSPCCSNRLANCTQQEQTRQATASDWLDWTDQETQLIKAHVGVLSRRAKQAAEAAAAAEQEAAAAEQAAAAAANTAAEVNIVAE